MLERYQHSIPEEPDLLDENLNLKREREERLINKMVVINQNLNSVLDAKKKLENHQLLSDDEIEKLGLDAELVAMYKGTAALIRSTANKYDEIRVQKLIDEENQSIKKELETQKREDIEAKIDLLVEVNFKHFEDIAVLYSRVFSPSALFGYEVSLFLELVEKAKIGISYQYDEFRFKNTDITVYRMQAFTERTSLNEFLKYMLREGVSYEEIEKAIADTAPIIDDAISRIVSHEDYKFDTL